MQVYNFSSAYNASKIYSYLVSLNIKIIIVKFLPVHCFLPLIFLFCLFWLIVLNECGILFTVMFLLCCCLKFFSFHDDISLLYSQLFQFPLEAVSDVTG